MSKTWQDELIETAFMGGWAEIYPSFSNFPPSIWAVSILNLEGLQIRVCQNSFDKLLIQSNNSIRYSLFLISDGLRLFSVGKLSVLNL